MNLSLVYLSYIPFGKKYLEDFLASYTKRPAGVDHTLVILFNGYENTTDTEPFLEVLDSAGVKYQYILSTEKFDIASYFYVARELKTELIAFVNTYSIILHDNWLSHLYKNLVSTNAGCVSATGSWGDFRHEDEYAANIRSLLRLRFTMNSIKKIIFFRYNFYPKVKAHLRTNAFMINRELFAGLRFDPVKPGLLNLLFNLSGNKLKSLCFEHGNNGFTAQLEAKGFEPLIVDKNGNGYRKDQWKEAKTFWIAEQEFLLVSDNQTRKYQDANAAEKASYTYAAWGSE